MKPVQQQRGAADCWLFAIAFSTDLAFGEDPTKISYEQTKLRDHLRENEEMEQFPRAKQPAATNVHTFAIPVYCVCRMPETLDNMVECEA